MSVIDADVVVVGAGPAGSATATHLARSGLRVSLLEKSKFPREKVCGDGLTPRGTRQLIRLGIDTSTEAGWLHNKGLRIYGGKRPSNCSGLSWRTSLHTGWFGHEPISISCSPATPLLQGLRCMS